MLIVLAHNICDGHPAARSCPEPCWCGGKGEVFYLCNTLHTQHGFLTAQGGARATNAWHDEGECEIAYGP